MASKIIRACALILAIQLPFAVQAEDEQYTFKVLNKTDTLITELLVSEDGKTWSKFDLGGGVAPSAEATMAWDKSTNGQNCEQQVKAQYKDGTESAATSFDFCEKDLELEFS